MTSDKEYKTQLADNNNTGRTIPTLE